MLTGYSMPPNMLVPTVHPRILLTSHLNSPCTAIVATASPFKGDLLNENLSYIVYGKANGEIVVSSEYGEIQQHIMAQPECAITAIVCGDCRHEGETEIFVIAANGVMRAFSYPRRHNRGVPNFTESECQFEQLLNANICFAEILDFDQDGKNEMLVAMTDRVGK
uniref:Integrin-alpha FG-GAP repeat-containing protein 2 n=1 Tax=Steinernema glaseri TaxID=37863 RepID=A0A1I8A6B2_9BILA